MQPPISRHETLRSIGFFFLAVCLGAIASVSDPVLIRAAVEAHEVVSVSCCHCSGHKVCGCVLPWCQALL